MKAVLHTDGGARGNPGPAAIGVVLEFPGTNQKTVELAETIGETTNNVAEYRAILRGLTETKTHGATEVDCYLDSELVVRQLTGEYRVKDRRLAHLVHQVSDLSRTFTRVRFFAIPRKGNRQADRLVNRALDGAKKNTPPR
jgi:ribonuclease HI